MLLPAHTGVHTIVAVPRDAGVLDWLLRRVRGGLELPGAGELPTHSVDCLRPCEGYSGNCLMGALYKHQQHNKSLYCGPLTPGAMRPSRAVHSVSCCTLEGRAAGGQKRHRPVATCQVSPTMPRERSQPARLHRLHMSCLYADEPPGHCNMPLRP